MRNRFDRGDQNEVNLVSYRDLLTNIFGMLLLVIGILIFLVNPIAKKEQSETQPKSDVRVELFWPNEMDVDIDLWCKAPGDVPVGYSNKGGKIFNLVRDDLGFFNDVTNINYEVMFSRGAPPGEYVCNAHWYSNTANIKEVPVKLVLTIIDTKPGSNYMPPPIVVNATLHHIGEEITLIRWTLDSDSHLERNSINHLYMPLRERTNNEGANQ